MKIKDQNKMNVEMAKKLLQWNSKNLVSHADLKKSDLSHFFALSFQVKANGSSFEANHDNYYDFLNTFRSQIKTIDYVLQDFIVDESHVVIPLTANIQTSDNRQQTFDAILILKFNKESKIILWQEVYVEVKKENDKPI